MRIFRPGLLARTIYPAGIFRLPSKERILFLSFDDGPSAGSTENILGILNRYGIRAVFFCIGKAAEEHPDLIIQIRSEGHVTGNHGYYHLDGFRTSAGKYYENAEAADDLTSPFIFRPPYGRLTLRQYRAFRNKYHLVFWDIMAYDFDPGLASDRSLNSLKKRIRPGSVIVLHDTPGSSVHSYLGDFIDFAVAQGYRFDIPAFLNQ